MSEKDEKEFIKMILDRKDTLIFDGRFHNNPNPKPISKIPSFGTKEKLIFTNLNLNVFPLSSKGKGEFEGKYMFELFKDARIEFNRCYYNDDILVVGRLFAKVGWLKNKDDNKIYKSWYSSIERWIKKKYIKIDKDWWISPNAEKWSLRRGKLSFGPPPGALVKPLSDCILMRK